MEGEENKVPEGTEAPSEAPAEGVAEEAVA